MTCLRAESWAHYLWWYAPTEGSECCQCAVKYMSCTKRARSAGAEPLCCEDGQTVLMQHQPVVSIRQVGGGVWAERGGGREGLGPWGGWGQWQPLPLNPNHSPELGNLTWVFSALRTLRSGHRTKERRTIGATVALPRLGNKCQGHPSGSLGGHRIQHSPVWHCCSPGFHQLQNRSVWLKVW